jgi:Raf kinase inhibitor-like YbhB/YbcL family protein
MQLRRLRMELTSPAFGNNQPIPANHTNKGAGSNPPLMINNIPPGTQSLAIVVHDPDAPRGDFTHWTIWNISATAGVLPENHVPTGAVQGVNDFGQIGYGAPAPPSGEHHYIFDVYALNAQLPLPAGAALPALLDAMQGHIIATAQLIGTVAA